ncbi:carboxypeptidase [Streptomyces clavuligerus]|nr:carboxypeptidase [Streptomyces clavuligerus]
MASVHCPGGHSGRRRASAPTDAGGYMKRRAGAILAAVSLVTTALAVAPTARAEQPGHDGGGGLSVWHAQVSRAQVPLVIAAGADGHELGSRVPERGSATVELHLTDRQAGELREQGVTVTEHRLSAAARDRVEAAGDGVFRPYGGARGLGQEILDTARAHPALTKAVSIGRTVKGQDILALKVSKGARSTRDGARPATLYLSNQHAREWITPEMTRRLMHHYLNGYGKDPRITRIVDTTELWFVLSANPDGYDHTFRGPVERQWRKNLRDHDGDGVIEPTDGVDLNRNFSYKWAYDNEGSSPDPGEETYRGPRPSSEPETRAMDAFMKRIGFEMGVNYHSAASLILYGVGWQVGTPSPDDVLHRALAGTPAKPAIPGYRPQIASDLYTTNGETDGHAANVNGTVTFTPEMSTCAGASRVDPDDAWEPADCASVFTFPDDEKLIRQEFEKNIPFALAVAETAKDRDRVSSPVGASAAPFTPDPFTVSYAAGADQPVSVVARKSLRDKRVRYRVDGGRTHSAPLTAWRGGETFGGEDNLVLDEYRAPVKGARTGASVRVWFTGKTARGTAVTSDSFTYRVAPRPRAATLVLAEEGGTAPARHPSVYTRALAANQRSGAVWDVATQGVPHPLGVLGHFRSVVWYTGAVTPSWPTTRAVRAYLNEGGRLVNAGERAGGGVSLGNGVSDDFAQYYQGASSRIPLTGVTSFRGAGGLAGASGPLGDAPGNPLDAAGVYTVTSHTLPPALFPRFRGAAAGDYPGVRLPFTPYEGQWYAAARHRGSSWQRLSRQFDLTGVTAADAPRLDLRLSAETENGYDHALIEAHTVGGDDWTTLPDRNGATGTAVPEECEAGFFAREHPFLQRYLTVSGSGCAPTGTSGSWNSITGSTNGWRATSFDLSAWAGKRVEISVAYVTDSVTGGHGVFLDDTRLVTRGGTAAAEGFETSLGAWSATESPAGSPAPQGWWTRSQELFPTAGAVTTRDTVLLGFGLEHLTDEGARARVLGRALGALKR